MTEDDDKLDTTRDRTEMASGPDTEQDPRPPFDTDATPAGDEPEEGSARLHEQPSELPTRSSEPPTTAPSLGVQMPQVLDTTTLIASLVIVASLVMVLFNLQDSSLKNANTGSRYATIESLVDYGTFYIDDSEYRGTIDKVKVGDHYLSSKPPTLPTYAAGAYWLYQKVTGRTIADYEGPVVWFVSLCTGWLFHLLFLIFFYRLCRLLVKRELALIGSLAAAAFGYLGVAYATAINNHSIGAAIALVGLYYAFRIRNGHDPRGYHWWLAGLCFGVLVAVDLTSGAFLPFVTLYLATHDLRRTLTRFLPLLLPGIVCHLVLGYITTGSFEPAYLNSELKDFEGNYFKGNQSGIDALREPKHIYAFNALFGHHGLFSMTPLFCFAAWEIVRCFRLRVRVAETLVVTGTTLVITAFYIYRTRNYGGWCVGMRWFVPFMPLLFVYFAMWLDRVRMTRTLWAMVLAAFGVGAFHVQDGLTSPFQFSRWHNFLDDAPNRGRVGKKINAPKPKKKERTTPRAGSRIRNKAKSDKSSD